jgi:hypothetical protein
MTLGHARRHWQPLQDVVNWCSTTAEEDAPPPKESYCHLSRECQDGAASNRILLPNQELFGERSCR